MTQESYRGTAGCAGAGWDRGGADRLVPLDSTAGVSGASLGCCQGDVAVGRQRLRQPFHEVDEEPGQDEVEG